jgi:carboxyl-terminal processing protease
VVGISKGSAADVAGLEQGDQLVAVAGRRLDGVSPFQASALISAPLEGADGDSGSSTTTTSSSTAASTSGRGEAAAADPAAVVLTVRKAAGRVEDFAVPRPVTQLASPVRYALQTRAGGRVVGSILIKSFTARAQRDVAAAVAELQGRGAQELELDLRDNRWGGSGRGEGRGGRGFAPLHLHSAHNHPTHL